MGISKKAAISAAEFIQSPILRRSSATFTDATFVRLDVTGANLGLKSSGSSISFSDVCGLQSIVSRIDRSPGDITSIELLDPDAEDLPPLAEDGRGGSWLAFVCEFESGVVDHIFLRLRRQRSIDLIKGILGAMWPVLREDCIREVASPESKAAVDALLWTVSKKSDAAVFVLNAAGQVLHVNETGRDMLEAKTVLHETSSGLSCATKQQTGGFVKAIKACLIEPNISETDFILFLNSSDGEISVPVSLSRYQASRDTMPLVVAIIPQQPDRKKIEMLALKMGLTPSEARVAGLMQLGLPNRQAAKIAGLKEQTFSTYSKRVLAKLNVGCRAEMAHMLTWQASVGRVS